jgi:cytochrome P450
MATNLRDTAFSYDPFSREVHADPFWRYKVLRDEFPLYRNERLGFWALSRWDDVQPAVRDWRSFSSAKGNELDDAPAVYAALFGPGNYMNLDPPPHDRIRRIVQRSFSPKAIAALEPELRGFVAEVLSRLIERGHGDLAREVAWSLPVFAISRLVGFPREDHDDLLGWLYELFARAPGETTLPEHARAAGMEVRRYLDVLLEERRRDPAGDLLSEMVLAERAGTLVAEEAPGLCFITFGAGMDATAALVAAATELFRTRPADRRRLAEEPELLPDAVEEVVRFASPVHGIARTAARDVETPHGTIPEGDPVWLVLAAANRDERRFDDPDTFDPFRERVRSVGFGDGIHHCVGAPLARLSTRVFLQELFSRVGGYELPGETVRLHQHNIPAAPLQMEIVLR